MTGIRFESMGMISRTSERDGDRTVQVMYVGDFIYTLGYFNRILR